MTTKAKPTYEELERRVQELEKIESELEYSKEMLRESENLFKQLYEKAPLGYQSLDENGHFIVVNQTWLDTLGYAKEEVIGKSFADFINPDLRDHFKENFPRFKSSGEILGVEFEMVKKNGNIIQVSLTGKISRDENGNFQQTHYIFHDITERRLTEVALNANEERFSLLVENAPNAIFVQTQYRFAYLNPAAVRRFGAESMDQLLGQSVLDRFEPHFHELMRERIRQLNEEKTAAPRLEQIYLRMDGSPFHVEVAEVPIHWQGQDGALVFFNEITERKQAETYREMGREILQILNEPGDLQESIQRVLATLKTRTGVDAVGLRLQEGEDFPYFVQDGFSKDFLLTENTLVESGKDGGVCRDKDGDVRLECTCGLVISGKTDPSNPLFTQGGSSWTNDSFPFLDLPPDQDPRIHPRNNCIHQGYASVALIPVRTSDRIVGLIQLNDKRKGRFTLETIEMLEGIAAHVGSALMRKRAEEEQEKLQTQLTQAQKMESVGRLAGGVAHDFNNMLGVILGHTELALLKTDEDNDNDLLSDLNEIQKAAKRSANITKQLLAFARKEIISPKQLDLNDTVESMLNMLRRLIGEDIDLVWQPAARMWPVKMDPSQIDQILANLCVNARDAISGVGKLTIETGKQTFDEKYGSDHPGFIPGDFVLLAVSDNGCGMDKETQDNLFEPFFTTKEVGKGTGLGLATIYGIVKQNNGFINVYSEPDQGSTFKIYLPRMVADEDADKAVSEKKTAAGGTETILLVEDEPSILRMIRMMLKRKGYTVLSAATPTEAFEKAKNHSGSIDLLMTDVIMPEMHGRSLAEKITDIYPDIRLLFMSGYTADVIAHHGILDEGVAFIQKPFLMADLTEKLRDVLETASDKT